MLDLTMTITADASQAKRELSDVEGGIKRLESSSKQAEQPITKVVQALSGQSGATDRVVKSSRVLEDSTRKLSSATVDHTKLTNDQWMAMAMAGKLNDDLRVRANNLTSSTASLTTGIGLSHGALMLWAGGLVIAAAAIGGVIKFLYDSSKAYVEQSGILEVHQKAIDGVKDAWGDMLFKVGAALLGSNFDIRNFLHSLEFAIRRITDSIAGAILQVKSWITTVQEIRAMLPHFAGGTLERNAMQGNISVFGYGPGQVDPSMNPQTALRDADGNLTAKGRLWNQEQNAATSLMMSGGDFGRPTGAMATRVFEESEREREQAARQALANAKRLRAQIDKETQELFSDYFKLTTPRNDHAWEMAMNRYASGIALTPYDLQQLGINPDAMLSGLFQPRNDRREDFATTFTAAELANMGITPGSMFNNIPDARNDRSGLQRTFGPTMSAWQQQGYFRAQDGEELTGMERGVNFAGNAGAFASNALSMLGLGNSRGAQALNAGLQGMQMGAMFGPWGAVIGGGIGALAGLFGKSQGRRELDAANTEIRGQQSGLLSQFGSLENIRTLDALMGTDLAGGWGHQGPAGLAAFGKEMDQFASGANGAMNTMIRNALTAGTAIPAAMQPILETLIRQGELTQENANLLLGLPENGVPAFAEIAAAAERYGLTLDSLGPKVEQIRIDEVAARIAADFQLFTDAGADMNNVLRGMADDVQSLIDSAMRMGGTLPDSLKPIITSMIDLGLLTDANGQKLSDIGQLDFAAPLKDSIDDLVKALNDLIRTLGGVPGAAEAAANGWNAAVAGVHPWPMPGTAEAPEPGDDGYYGEPVTGPGARAHTGGYLSGGHVFPRYHGGGYLSDEFPITAQSGEYMMRRSAVARYGRGFMQSVNDGSYTPPARQDVTIRVPVVMDGEKVAEVVARRTLQ